ncbi:hypothetical protein, partial [Leuconostoc falkenbergense]|uniref:hypothetical protein n=1 Tax=Leuconostoc falkenbergense TaxID=2766470 RepID=UPI00293C2567
GTEIYRWNGNIWELLASPTTADDIAAAVTDAVAQAKSHTDEVKQGLSSDIATAKSQAASLANAAEANAKSAATSQFTQAQNALSDAKTDLTNSIASEASARNQAVAAANSQAQTYANQAKADALNTIAKEVTDRQNAVSALDTKATNAVNQAKSDITDTINAISVGGRNLLLNSKTLSWGVGTNTATTSTKVSYDSTTNMWHITSPKGGSGNAGIYFSQTNNVSNLITKGQQWAFSFDIKGTGVYSQFGIEASLPFNNISGNVPTDWTRVSSTGTATGTNSIVIYFNSIDVALDVYIKLPELETGNLPTDWTPAPEDVLLDYTTKDDQIKTTISQYQTTNDGKVTKAQTDATTALGQVTTKVSQTDYDTKTGDLTTKYTQVKQTADSQAADIVDIKKTAMSQASKINSISSDVDGTKQSISDIETTQDSQSDKINQITTDVDGTKQSITDIQTKDGKQDTRMGTIETSVSGVKSDFSSYKTTNDGVVKTAQTTAQTAVDGLKNKISQTDYNTKTGQLQTDLTTTTQTANQAKTDIVSIKQKDGDQDSRMTQIESDASGVKTTVSDLSTAQGKQSGDISTLQQRADGFDATVTKVDSLGQINQLMNTEFSPDFAGWYDRGLYGKDIAASLGAAVNGSNVFMKVDGGPTRLQSAPIAVIPGTKISYSVQKLTSSSMWSYINNVDVKGNMVNVPGTSSPEFGAKNSVGYTKVENITIPSGVVYISFGIYLGGISNGNVFAQPMLVFSDHAGTYIQGNYNNNSAIAKAQLTADNAALAISDYKTNADGRISQAQADITATAKQVATKVSQTDYDKKTGDLTTAVSKAQTTADGVVTTVGNYQTSNDKRVKAAESAISQNANDITLRATTSDLNSAKSDLNSSISQVKITADSISNFVRDSSGNISSDFQTALSKTSIITGSTLATSIQTQTSSQITSALTDNNKNIIAMINLDTSGVQIAGKNIVLDGDTTVTGAFKVSQANIANGAIGTAQIGDAAITSAKIANLDVSKITGDVTNFVKSGWNNAYGSNVTIDGTGMVVSYGNTSTSFENGNVLFKQLADYADGSNQVETIGSISTTHGGTVNNIVIGLYDQTHIPFGSTDGKKIGSPTGEIYGGDLIAFGKARDFNGNFDHIFSYSNQTASLYYGITEGFNFRDKVNFNSNEIVSGSV